MMITSLPKGFYNSLATDREGNDYIKDLFNSLKHNPRNLIESFIKEIIMTKDGLTWHISKKNYKPNKHYILDKLNGCTNVYVVCLQSDLSVITSIYISPDSPSNTFVPDSPSNTFGPESDQSKISSKSNNFDPNADLIYSLPVVKGRRSKIKSFDDLIQYILDFANPYWIIDQCILWIYSGIIFNHDRRYHSSIDLFYSKSSARECLVRVLHSSRVFMPKELIIIVLDYFLVFDRDEILDKLYSEYL